MVTEDLIAERVAIGFYTEITARPGAGGPGGFSSDGVAASRQIGRVAGHAKVLPGSPGS
jgi:hypothetical protein